MSVDSLVSLCGNFSGVLFQVHDASGDGIAEFWNDEYERDTFSDMPVSEWRIMQLNDIAVVRIDLEEVE